MIASKVQSTWKGFETYLAALVLRYPDSRHFQPGECSLVCMGKVGCRERVGKRRR
jgi:hypothetical protein